MSSSEKKTSPLLYFLYLVIGIVLFGLLVALLLPPLSEPREYVYRTACKNNLKQIALALHNYHDKYQCFPPAYIADSSGRPMHSWRVLLLPFLENEELYKQYRFNEPWDGPHNRQLADRLHGIFHCPSDRPRDKSAASETSYVVVVGPNTMFPGTECRKFRDFSDGMIDTILVVEMVNSGIQWMEPRDLAFEDAVKGVNRKDGPGISSGHEGGAQIARGDATVKFITDKTSEDTLRWLLERNDGHEVPDY